MKMYIGGQWVSKGATVPVLTPFDGTPIDEVPRADLEDVKTAVATAVRGAQVMAAMPAYERSAVLRKAAGLLAERQEEFARTIALEAGKVIAESRTEVRRAIETITISSEEAKRIHGETVPLDAAPGNSGQFGFTIRVPCEVVVAISPFNFPLNGHVPSSGVRVRHRVAVV